MIHSGSILHNLGDKVHLEGEEYYNSRTRMKFSEGLLLIKMKKRDSDVKTEIR